MNPRPDTHRGRRITLVLVPWLVYVAVTVVAPAIVGATREPRFAGHAVITLGISGALAMLWLAATRARARARPCAARRHVPCSLD